MMFYVLMISTLIECRYLLTVVLLAMHASVRLATEADNVSMR